MQNFGNKKLCSDIINALECTLVPSSLRIKRYPKICAYLFSNKKKLIKCDLESYESFACVFTSKEVIFLSFSTEILRFFIFPFISLKEHSCFAVQRFFLRFYLSLMSCIFIASFHDHLLTLFSSSTTMCSFAAKTVEIRCV